MVDALLGSSQGKLSPQSFSEELGTSVHEGQLL